VSNEQEDENGDEVQILNISYTGERARPDITGTGPPQHERAVPLPFRVRTGAIEPEGLTLEGNLLPWETIQYMALGLLHHSLGSMEPPKTMVRQVFSKLTNKEDTSVRKVAQYQEAWLLDIYGAPNDPPYRLDSVNINYRSFLGRDVAMISMHNFYRLVVRIAREATLARVNQAAKSLIKRRRDQIRPVGAIYDFETDCQNELFVLESLTATSELDLTRDNYAEESEE
jgi:hypothetical protein